jgi:hypothetical protein
MGNSFNLKNRYLIEINLITLTLLFYLFRTSIPFLKYPFLLFYIGLLFYIITNKFRILIPTLKEFIVAFYLVIFLSLIVIISFFLSNKIYLTIFKDVSNSIILLSIIFLMTFIVNRKEHLKDFIAILINLIITFSIIISIYNILSILNVFENTDPFYSTKKSFTSSITKNIDYNFAIIPILFGIICIIFKLTKTKYIRKILGYNLIFILYSLSIFLSGSRRGMICYFGIVFLLFLIQIHLIFKKDSIFMKLRMVYFYLFLSVFFVSLFTYEIMINTSSHFKQRVLSAIGSTNSFDTKTRITLAFFRYKSVFNKNTSYQDLYNSIWTTSWESDFDPRDPDSNWGTRTHSTIEKLMGNNVEIVPKNTKGYYMDSTCNPTTWGGNAYSYTYIGKKIEVNQDDFIKASVFCFVSKDFNGDWARIIMGSTKKGITSGKNYNYLAKETWQKLTCSISCVKDSVDILLYFSKVGVTDFSTLKGSIIFAYPTIQIVRAQDSSFSDTLDFYQNARFDRQLRNSKRCFIKLPFFKTKDFNNTYNSQSPNAEFYDLLDENSQRMMIGSFSLVSNVLTILGSNNFDNDLIRRWASRFVSEDTTYFDLKKNLTLDSLSDNIINFRWSRWEFAIQIFTKEYNLKQKIFGGGFNFLNWYGYYFFGDKTRSDYPHNPFLSVLLYSGIFGLIIYLIFMYRVFFYYIKYLKKYKILAVFFIITFIFSFFSAGSPFDPPIMGFFVMLPFFIHYVHIKDQSERAL